MKDTKFQIIFSSLAAFSTTIIYLLSSFILDTVIKNYKISNIISLIMAVIIGYIIQRGVFTKNITNYNKYDKKSIRKYLISEFLGIILHQLLFLYLLQKTFMSDVKLRIILPTKFHIIFLRIICSSTIFVLLFILRKFWVFK